MVEKKDRILIYENMVKRTGFRLLTMDLEETVVVLCTEVELRLLARSLDMEVSALSARSSASSSSCCTLRYLARLTAAISSYKHDDKYKDHGNIIESLDAILSIDILMSIKVKNSRLPPLGACR